MTKISDNYTGKSLQQERVARRKREMMRFDGQIISPASGNAESFVVKLKNEGTTPKRIVVWPGSLASVDEVAKIAGFTVDAIAKDGTIVADGNDPIVTCYSEILEYAQRFVARNPTRVTEIQFQADNQSQFSNHFCLTKISPVEQLGSKRNRPSEFQKPGDSNTTLVSVPFEHLQLDDQSVFDVVIGAGRELSMTFFFGASRNDAKTLNDAAHKY